MRGQICDKCQDFYNTQVCKKCAPQIESLNCPIVVTGGAKYVCTMPGTWAISVSNIPGTIYVRDYNGENDND